MFNSFWNVPPKTYSRAQRKACQKKEIYNDNPFPEIELPRHCDERVDSRKTLDFRGAIKILDDEEDLLVSNKNLGSGHLAIPLRTKHGLKKADDIASANLPFSSFDDFNSDDDHWMALNSTPRSNSVIRADEEIDDLSTIKSEEFDLTSNDDASDQEQGTSKMSSSASDKENEVGNQQNASDKEIEDVTQVETKNKFLRAKCRKGTPHPTVKLPPLIRQGRLFEPLKNRRNVMTNDKIIQKQRGGLASFPKCSDIALKVMNWKINLENDGSGNEEQKMKFRNNDENRLDGKKSRDLDKVDVQFVNPTSAVGFDALLRQKPETKSSSAAKVISRVHGGPENVRGHPIVKTSETNQERPGCCRNDDSPPDVKNNTLIENHERDEVSPTCDRVTTNATIDDSARIPDDDIETDLTPFRPPRSKRKKIRRKKGARVLGKMTSDELEGRCRRLKQNLVSRKELDFVKISELLGVLNTKNEDGHDVQTRDDDEDLVLDGSHAPSKESESKRDLENPARRTPLPIAKKQLTSTFIHNSDLASKTLRSPVQRQSMGLSSIRYEARSSFLEKHPTTREVDSRELMDLESPGSPSIGCEGLRAANGSRAPSKDAIVDLENDFQAENLKSMEEDSAGDVAAEKCALTRSSKLLLPSIPKSENPMSKGKIEKDSIEQCWLTEDVDYNWGPCYLEVYKYQTYDPNVSYPQDDLELA